MRNRELMHWGVLGMKLGVRRYQNADGTLTAAGKARYGENGEHRYTSFGTKMYSKAADNAQRRGYGEDRVNKMRAKAAKSQELDDRMAEYAKRVSAGGNIATRLLTGGAVGGRTYQMALAALGGQNEKGFTGKKVAAFLANAIPWNQALIREAYSSGVFDKAKKAYDNL